MNQAKPRANQTDVRRTIGRDNGLEERMGSASPSTFSPDQRQRQASLGRGKRVRPLGRYWSTGVPEYEVRSYGAAVPAKCAMYLPGWLAEGTLARAKQAVAMRCSCLPSCTALQNAVRCCGQDGKYGPHSGEVRW